MASKKMRVRGAAASWQLKTRGLIIAVACAVYAAPAWSSAQSDREMTDANLRKAVAVSLENNDAVAAQLIDVKVDNGVVTLSGTIDHLLAKDLAVKMARGVRGVRGVRSVIDRLAVRPVAREDEAIKTDVKNALLYDPVTESFEVDVVVDSGEITLTGTVDSWIEKELVGQVAKGVKGIRSLSNEIDVEMRDARPDAEIKRDIERRFAVDPFVYGEALTVSVDDGEVVLRGRAPSALQKENAINACWISGVRMVDGDGAVVDPSLLDATTRKKHSIVYKSDEQLEKDVNAALFYDPRVNTFDITVEALQQVVTLLGRVDNYKAKRVAEQDARDTPGAWMVENDLVVRTDEAGPITDDAIADKVKSKLKWDPVVNRFDVIVIARNGKVHLSGAVDSFYEKWRIEDIASTVKGVAAVSNNLVVDPDWTWRSDAQITEDVNNELFWSPFVNGDDVSVSSADAVVTMTGTVDTFSEFDAAVENAFEGGAESVVSYLEVKGAATPLKQPMYFNKYYYYYY